MWAFTGKATQGSNGSIWAITVRRTYLRRAAAVRFVHDTNSCARWKANDRYPVNMQDWNNFLAGYPEAHLLQTDAWGQLKASFGWKARHVIMGQTGAQVLFRRLPMGLSFAYLAKGPVGVALDALWYEIDLICAQERAAFLKWEPDCWHDEWEAESPPPGYRRSAHAIQPPRTILVQLDDDDESILGRMKQKTRYNIRLAKRRGVSVDQSTDLEGFHQLMEATGARDRFGVHSLAYYRAAFRLFSHDHGCVLLMAKYQDQPLAGMMVFAHGQRAWYLYGASSNQYRNLMPNYLLQWEAMRWAKSRGCRWFDLWGVPDSEEDELEANFTRRNDGLWGVYRFKRGFGGTLKRAAGPWDRVYRPLLYRFYLWWSKRRT